MHPPKDDARPVCSTKYDTKYRIHRQAAEKMIEEVRKEQGTEDRLGKSSYFDPEMEQRRLHSVYRKIEQLLQTLSDCETARTLMNEHSRSGAHRKILKK